MTAPTVTETASTVTETASTVTEEAPTVTETADTVTEEAPTATEYAPTVTETAEPVTSAAPAVTRTETVKITSTEVAGGGGIQWRYFDRNPARSTETEDPGNYRGAGIYSGFVSNINTLQGPAGGNIVLYNGVSVISDRIATVNRGYFVARYQGTYRFSGFFNSGTRNDDQMAAWVGNKALGTNWNANNFDMRSRFNGGEQPYQFTTTTDNVVFPITIFFTNNDGAGALRFIIATPVGTFQSTNNWFAPACPGSQFG